MHSTSFRRNRQKIDRDGQNLQVCILMFQKLTARLGITSGPSGVADLDVSNWQQARGGLSVSRGSQAIRPESRGRKR